MDELRGRDSTDRAAGLTVLYAEVHALVVDAITGCRLAAGVVDDEPAVERAGREAGGADVNRPPPLVLAARQRDAGALRAAGVDALRQKGLPAECLRRVCVGAGRLAAEGNVGAHRGGLHVLHQRTGLHQGDGARLLDVELLLDLRCIRRSRRARQIDGAERDQKAVEDRAAGRVVILVGHAEHEGHVVERARRGDVR